MSLKDIILKELNPKYDLENMKKSEEENKFIERDAYHCVGLLKTLVRGGTIGAIAGAIYGSITNENPIESIKFGMCSGVALDSWQYILRYGKKIFTGEFKSSKDYYR